MQLRVCRLQFNVCSTGDVVITQSQTTGQTASESFIQNHHGCKVHSLPSLAGIKKSALPFQMSQQAASDKITKTGHNRISTLWQKIKSSC